MRRAAKVSIGASAVYLLLAALTLRAQSVQPVITEYTIQANGSFEVSNDLPVPIVATFEPQSFSMLPNGRAAFTPLSSAIHVDLSASSMRVPPHQRRRIYYKASADSLPAWFTIYSTLMGVPGKQGVTVQLRLPHTVYLLPKRQAQKTAIRIDNIATRPGSVGVDIHNDGDDFIRTKGLDILLEHGKKLSFPGFPLLPHSYRALELPIKDGIPATLVLQCPNFAVEQSLKLAANPVQ